MAMFYKILNGMTPSYLRDHIPEQITPNVCLRNTIKTRPFSRTERYGNIFFTFCINNWNDIDNDIKYLPTLNEFKNKLFKFIRPKRNTFFNIRDNIGIKLLTKIRVSFSDLRDHRYDHNFNCENPLCSCGIEDETTTHFFLCCPLYYQLRITYLSKISEIVGSDVTVLPNEHLSYILMYGSNVYNDVCNELIILETIQFIKKSRRFKNIEAFVFYISFLNHFLDTPCFF